MVHRGAQDRLRACVQVDRVDLPTAGKVTVLSLGIGHRDAWPSAEWDFLHDPFSFHAERAWDREGDTVLVSGVGAAQRRREGYWKTIMGKAG